MRPMVCGVFAELAQLSGEAASVGVGLINTIGTLAGFPGPYATSWLRDSTGSYQAPMLLVAALMFISAIVVVLVERSARTASRLDTRPSGTPS
ncbi:hypothetical protein [Paraburkholderia heleia]|uniref:hypothetical protein n=1 Tax=Paraburkholderia heleia TaxID=634127 RepID=UPI0031D296D5